MSVIRVRDIRPEDVPALVAMNQAVVPAVGPLDRDSFVALLAMCDVAMLALDREGRVASFVLSLGPGQPYDDECYRWFEERGIAHQYIDRFVVAPHASGRGIGRALYASVYDQATTHARPEITCAVNLEPPNPASLSFHTRLGFHQVGDQMARGGAVRVALLSRPTRARTV